MGSASLDFSNAKEILACLEQAGFASSAEITRRQMESAKALGLMPDEPKVFRHTLESYGFQRQNSKMENISLQEAIDLLLPVITAPTIAVFNFCWSYGAAAVFFNGLQGYRLLNHVNLLNRMDEARLITEAWVRSSDSSSPQNPFPRRAVSRQRRAKRRPIPADSDVFTFYQPNPQGNFIGDCVIRAISGVMGLSWGEALELLADALPEHSVTVNAEAVFQTVLERNGFVRHPALRGRKGPLTGRAFCEEIARRYHNKERIFAMFGTTHVAAVLSEDDGSYKIHDCWDSTGRRITCYWVKKPQPAIPEKLTRLTSFSVGDTICHPSFGTGFVTAVDTDSAALSVLFSAGQHRLAAEWALQHCTCL